MLAPASAVLSASAIRLRRGGRHAGSKIGCGVELETMSKGKPLVKVNPDFRRHTKRDVQRKCGQLQLHVLPNLLGSDQSLQQ